LGVVFADYWLRYNIVRNLHVQQGDGFASSIARLGEPNLPSGGPARVRRKRHFAAPRAASGRFFPPSVLETP
jgi:hypothetical protein